VLDVGDVKARKPCLGGGRRNRPGWGSGGWCTSEGWCSCSRWGGCAQRSRWRIRGSWSYCRARCESTCAGRRLRRLMGDDRQIETICQSRVRAGE